MSRAEVDAALERVAQEVPLLERLAQEVPSLEKEDWVLTPEGQSNLDRHVLAAEVWMLRGLVNGTPDRRRILDEMVAEVGRMPEDEIPGHDGFVETR